MPYLRIETNFPAPRAAVPRLSAGLAALLGKDEKWMMVRLQNGGAMTFGGNDAPCAYVQLESLGLDEDATPALAQGLFALLGEVLDVPADRVYLHLDSPPRARYAWDGKTFG